MPRTSPFPRYRSSSRGLRLCLLLGVVVFALPSLASARAKRRSTRPPAPHKATRTTATKTGAAPLAAAVTLGSLPAPPTFDELADLRGHRPKGGDAKAAKARAKEMAQLRAQLARSPADRNTARWLHRLAELAHVEAHWRVHLAERARQKAVAARDKELRRVARLRKRYRRKVKKHRKRHWPPPAKPDLTLKTTVPPRPQIDVTTALQHYETIIANHPRYRRMDDVLLQAGSLRIQQGISHHDLPAIATGEQYLNQVRHEFGWTPRASFAGAQLADLALRRRDFERARDLLQDLAENERDPVLRDYGAFRLARLQAKRDPKAAVAALTELAKKTPDATLRKAAQVEVARLGTLTTPSP